MKFINLSLVVLILIFLSSCVNNKVENINEATNVEDSKINQVIKRV